MGNQTSTRIVGTTFVIKSTALLILLSGFATNASAIAIDPSVSIQVTGTFDATNFGLLTNATQNGILTLVSGGSTSTASLSAAPSPLSGSLTNTGDSIGALLSATGTSSLANPTSSIGNLFADFTVNISNNSATDIFTVNLLLVYQNAVNSVGNDAFGQGEIILNTQSGTNQFVSDISSDTANGNQKFINPDFAGTNNLAQGTFGGAVSDNGSFLLSYVLNPGASILLGNNSPEARIFGGSFSSPGSFSASTNFSIEVQSVVNQQTPPPAVPEPQTVVLLGLSGLLLGLVRRIKANNPGY